MRTTDPEHEAFVQRFVERLRDAGDIEKRTYGGLYCHACEGFYYERDLVDGKCPIHGTEPVWLEEENYYFKLSAYQERLADWYRRHPGWVRPRSRYNEALSFIEQGLEDISISRELDHLGHPGAVGREAGHLRLGRRPHQLPLGADVRRARVRTCCPSTGRRRCT